MRAMAHLTLLLLMLWLGPGTSSALHRQKRLIGGKTCQPNERDYHVKLISRNRTHNAMCGGSLIHNQWILTAAHCSISGWILEATLGVHPGPGTTHQILANPVIFTDRDNNNNIRSHDIMLLQLPTPSTITPIALPQDCQNRPPIGASVRMAGYGTTMIDQNNRRGTVRSRTLQCVDLTVVDCKNLQNIVKSSRSSYLHEHWFCVQSAGKDTCSGDSGGGMVYQNTIYGVHAFSGNGNRACAEPAGVMDVCNYINWIMNTVNARILP